MPSASETFANWVDNYAKHPDQGFKLVKKKLQKDPGSVPLLLALATFESDLGRAKDALASCDAIKASSKAPLEPDLISALQDVTRKSQDELGTFSGVGGPRLGALWKDALDNCPRSWQKETRSEMLHAAIQASYWDLAQQLFARLQKEFPQNAKYHFAWIALCQIQAEKLPPEDKMSAGMRMLAYRSLKAAVENTIARKNTPRRIMSSNELRLLCETYSSQELADELLAVLDQPDVGISSGVDKYDVEFISLKIEILARLERWSDLRDYCTSGLESLCRYYEEASSTSVEIPNQLAWANAWQPWLRALQASAAISTLKGPEEISALISRFLALSPSHRNASNAQLHYNALFQPTTLPTAAAAFFSAHSSKLACFDDLRSVVQQLDSAQQSVFLQAIAECVGERPTDTSAEGSLSSWTVASINRLRLEYLLRLSQSGPGSVEELEKFVVECFKVHEPFIDQVEPLSNEALILAITALTKLGKDSLPHQLQATLLTQLIRETSPHNSNVPVLQLLVARSLGLGSMAVFAFVTLSLREVQYDSLGHLLYTRISTLHPHAVKLRNFLYGGEHKDPAASMEFALRWYERANDATLGTLCKDVENIYFDKLHEFIQFLDRVRRSYSATLMQIELCRVKRITGAEQPTNGPPRTLDLTPHDNRDFRVIPDYEHSTAQPYAEFLTGGSRPGRFWAARWQLHDFICSLLTTKSSALLDSQERVLASLLSFIESNAALSDAELTPAERSICQGWDLLIPPAIWLLLGASHPQACRDIKESTSALSASLSAMHLTLSAQALKTSDREELVFTSAAQLETWYLHLEFSRACMLLASTGAALLKQKSHHSGGKVSADALAKLKTEAASLIAVVQKQASALKESLRKDGRARVLQALKEGEIGAWLEKFGGGEQLRRYADDMVESAEEGLEGVLKSCGA